jgi:hypothetical protein
MDRAEALLIGGRSGAGKSVVGWEISARLRAAGVAHAILEGDFMAQVHPPPGDDPDRRRLTERNLTAVWANFAALGYRRLIYTNTLSVLPEMTGMFERALGADVHLTRVLLTASDETAHERLAARELGSELADGIAASDMRARVLDRDVASDAARVATDRRTVMDVATEIVALTGWSP